MTTEEHLRLTSDYHVCTHVHIHMHIFKNEHTHIHTQIKCVFLIRLGIEDGVVKMLGYVFVRGCALPHRTTRGGVPSPQAKRRLKEPDMLPLGPGRVLEPQQELKRHAWVEFPGPGSRGEKGHHSAGRLAPHR